MFSFMEKRNLIDKEGNYVEKIRTDWSTCFLECLSSLVSKSLECVRNYTRILKNAQTREIYA